MSLMPTCKKCGKIHWGFKRCALDVKTSETQDHPIPQPVAHKSKSNVGFPPSGDKFGFQMGVPFSKNKTSFKQELPPANT